MADVWLNGFNVTVGSVEHKLLVQAGFEVENAPKGAAKAKAPKTEPAPDPETGDGPVDYSKLRQPALKALLTERGIEFPKGAVKNAALVDLLVEADKTPEGETLGE